MLYMYVMKLFPAHIIEAGDTPRPANALQAGLRHDQS